MKQPSLTVHIEELVLEGLDHADGDRIRQAIAQELTGLGAGASAQSATISSVDGGTFPADGGAMSAGRQVARAIHGAK